MELRNQVKKQSKLAKDQKNDFELAWKDLENFKRLNIKKNDVNEKSQELIDNMKGTKEAIKDLET